MSFHRIFSILFFLSGMTAYSQSVGGITTGAALYCDSLNSGFISLTAYNGSVLHWEKSIDGGQTWTKLSNNTSTQSYTGLKSITNFRAIVKDGAFLQDTSTISTVSVHIAGNGGTVSGSKHFCDNSGSGQLILNTAPGKVLGWQSSIEGTNGWSEVNNTGTVLAYNNVRISTAYRAIVETLPGCPNDTSTTASLKIDVRSVSGTILNADTVCYGAAGDSLFLIDHYGTIADWYRSIDNSNWQPLNNPLSVLVYSTVTQNLFYKVTVKNGVCPAETSPVVAVRLFNTNPADAGSDQTITKHDPLVLQGSGNGSAKWSNENTLNDASLLTPDAHPLSTTLYVLTLTDSHGCQSADSVLINVNIPIPSAITPNNDGVNDYFKIDRIAEYPANSIHIFDRWGKEVYTAQPYQNEWNGKTLGGKDLPDDIYYYLFDFGDGQKIIAEYILIKR
jgi:gliding motility-associated-like protein